jgi:hypothetical protein
MAYKAVEVSLEIQLQSRRIWEKQIPAILSFNDMENLYIINYQENDYGYFYTRNPRH